jgi:hypothetical protein
LLSSLLAMSRVPLLRYDFMATLALWHNPHSSRNHESNGPRVTDLRSPGGAGLRARQRLLPDWRILRLWGPSRGSRRMMGLATPQPMPLPFASACRSVAALGELERSGAGVKSERAATGRTRPRNGRAGFAGWDRRVPGANVGFISHATAKSASHKAVSLQLRISSIAGLIQPVSNNTGSATNILRGGL